ncbi:hypothetical protein BDV59DRAFT_105380 [Aspergillus ambiguus]|uniref:uncharacterized protein n=1 Tax=Aspergillus ambiguus TaxID=176160 RepID=UPI003CCD3F8D
MLAMDYALPFSFPFSCFCSVLLVFPRNTNRFHNRSCQLHADHEIISIYQFEFYLMSISHPDYAGLPVRSTHIFISYKMIDHIL